MIMRYRLGLDLGANSLGWAVLKLPAGKNRKESDPDEIIATGVRIFEAGVEGDIEQGKDSSRGATRREARQPRRQNWRRQYRKAKVFGLMQSLKLLPPTSDRKAETRDDAITELDLALTQKWCPKGDVEAHQKLPYLLRAAALQELLSPEELGRALYHLNQRRGFNPNRKTDKADDEEAGKVYSGISTTDEARRDPSQPDRLRTLAEFVRDEFHLRDGTFEITSERSDSPTRRRIRRRYTARTMYRDEFCQIRDAQKQLGAKLSDADWARIERAMFNQRPLKSQRHLVGRCTLELNKAGKGRRRCTIAVSAFQEFRLLQTVNHLRIRLSEKSERGLEPAERALLIEHLMRDGDLPLKSRRKKGEDQPCASVTSLLKLPKGAKLSVQTFHNEDEDDGGETRLVGQRTNAKLAPLFGSRWWTIAESDRDQIILQVLHQSNPEALAAWAMARWELSSDKAQLLRKVSLEDGYGSLSLHAINRLLPHLRNGLSYAEARLNEYPNSNKPRAAQEKLPPVNDWNSDIRNPAVIRALSEVRKVVNTLIAKYGRPEQIHIELARDLKRSRKDRKKIFDQNEENRKRRERAKESILRDLKRSNPSRSDIEKWLLAEECNWQCPYTGKQISPHSLLVDSLFDVEHIYPRKYLDDSFANKTLCDHEFNRNRKKDRLPAECLSGPELEEVLARVRRFKTDKPEAKLKRFAAEEVSEDFVARQLNDTRYNSTLAADFLGTLYGGRINARGEQCIVTPTGNLTWMLRRGWGLDSIISGTDQKNRDDHRHHAIDAICIGMSSHKEINKVSELASKPHLPGGRFNEFLNSLDTPWKEFLTQAEASINSILVSHRPTRTIAGPLHAETNYSKPFVIPNSDPPSLTKSGKPAKAKPPTIVHRVRKSLDKLTEKEIQGDQIVDPNVRRAVQQKFDELCAKATTKAGRLPSNLWNDQSKIENFPRLLPSSDLAAKRKAKGAASCGSPIFKVRLSTDTKPRVIGTGVRLRYVASGKDSNYASMVYAILDPDGQELRWEHEIITRRDAYQRLSANGGGKKVSRNLRKQGKASAPPEATTEPAPERVLIPRTTEELLAMDTPPFKLKPGQTVRYLFTLVKNDMVRLEGPDGSLTLYRIQKLSESEIQLCEHTRTTITNADRTTWNRITSLETFRKRGVKKVRVSPIGEITEE